MHILFIAIPGTEYFIDPKIEIILNIFSLIYLFYRFFQGLNIWIIVTTKKSILFIN